MTTRAQRRILWVFSLWAGWAWAQDVQEGRPAADPGLRHGNLRFQMATEVGWRFADFTGNHGVAETFINQHSGPRLLEHALDVQSLDQRGLFFDGASMRSFGYGGDPYSATRLRLYKNRWYNFSAEFRRSRNLWDYNLLANPLNSVDTQPYLPVQQSPHRQQTVRRMTDFNFHLAPQSRIGVRWGYRRNVHEGPAFSSWHRGASGAGFEVQLQQDTRIISSDHQLGLDFRLLPRTNLSLDQALDSQQDSTSWRNLPPSRFRLPNGEPVDPGMVFITNFFTCEPVFLPGGAANPLCNGLLAYERTAPTHNRFPTTQFGFQSRYIRALALNGRVAYSSGSSRVRAFRESFLGLVVPANERIITTTGSSHTRRLLAAADLGAVWQVRPGLRLVETLRFSNLRIPGTAQTSTAILFGDSLEVAPNLFTPAGCSPPFVAPTCPRHSDLSPADAESAVNHAFLGEKVRSQQLQLDLDAHERVGLRLGHRYRHRIIITRWAQATTSRFFPDRADRGPCFAVTPDADGVCQVSASVTEAQSVTIREHTLLAGAWLQPVAAWRTDLDGEWSVADQVFTRIGPRGRRHYRVRTSYSPSPALDFTFAFRGQRQTNEAGEIGHRFQLRDYNLNAALLLPDSVSADLGYEYTRIDSVADICVSSSFRPPGTIGCALGIALFHQESFYASRVHFGYLVLGWRPFKRVGVRLGYHVSREQGSAVVLTPAAPAGSLRYRLHQPSAKLTLDLRPGLEWKSEWGYHAYNEKGVSGPLPGRDFRGNVVSSSIRYAF